MSKAALLLLPQCNLRDVSPLLEQLAQREWRLRTFSSDGQPVVTVEGLRVQADASLQSSVPVDLQLCIIPGGHYASEAYEDARLHRFLRQYDGQRKMLVASCEGVVCLAAAGLLGGLMYSAPSSLCERYPHHLRHAIHCSGSLTVDANVISSNGTNPDRLGQITMERVGL